MGFVENVFRLLLGKMELKAPLRGARVRRLPGVSRLLEMRGFCLVQRFFPLSCLKEVSLSNIIRGGPERPGARAELQMDGQLCGTGTYVDAAS